MADDIFQTAERLMKSNELKDFLASKQNAFLSSFTLMAEPLKIEKAKWQADYFDPINQKITSFIIGDSIIIKPEQDFLPNGQIQEIKIGDLKVGFFEAFEKSMKKFSETAHESASSFIAVLQNAAKMQWTITFITNSMKVIAYHIDAQTGETQEGHSGDFGIKF